VLTARVSTPFGSSASTARPVLPSSLPNSGIDKPSPPFTVSGSGGVEQFRITSWPEDSFNGNFVVLAIPLTGVLSTLNQLLVLEISISVAVIAATAILAFMIISIGLRPLQRMGAVAADIAAGDLSRRVEPATDRTEIGRLGLALNSMLEQIESAFAERTESNTRLRRFVADASHELRTPLTSILANLELLQERLDATERRGEEGEMIESALRSSKRMGRLVSDLLLLARADAGRTGARRECDLGAVAAAALSEVRPVADGHRLTLADRGPVPVDGNPDELHRLTVNLLDNGLRHTPAGTEIRVAVERRNGDAVLEVSDDGPGIPPGMEEQVFSRFVRGTGPADVAGDSGAGLGLAIVKAVAMSHGGDVDAGSSPSGGARFTVRLPLPKA
jgi:two-component system OmpR family sensor kinase